MTQTQWDKAVRDSGERARLKDEKRTYKAFGGDGGKKSGNSNVVASEIIEGAGGKLPANYNPPGRQPGLRVPEVDPKALLRK